MDKHYILPPLVRGRLLGFLNFFIDEVKIFKNICNLEECEVVVQVQWWGDPSPVLIRPKEFFLCQKKMKYLCQKTFYHSANYELKTNFSLLQNYFKACEVLELAVLEVFKNIFIGSAFLKNLVKIIEQANDPIVFPIVDYLGEIIGEIKIHIEIIAKYPESNTNNCYVIKESYVLCKTNNFMKEKEDLLEVRNLKKVQEISPVPQILEVFQNCSDFDDTFRRLKTIKKIEPQNKEFQDISFKNKTTNCSLKNLLPSKSTENHNQCQTTTLDHNFPQVEVYSDFSKVLSFPLKKNSFKYSLSKIEPRINHCHKPKKKNISTKGKSITKTLSGKKFDYRSCKKKFGATKKVSNHISQICKIGMPIVKNCQNKNKLSKQSCENTKPLNILRGSPISLPSSGISDKSVSLAESKSIEASQTEDKKKVLDYLLGFDMSKEEEYKALNDFKQMSPCQNFVETVNELFETHKTISQNLGSSSTKKINENEKAKKIIKIYKNIKFDFNDPIEKKYYETFFQNVHNKKSSIHFEITKFLNQPEKSEFLKEIESQEKTFISDLFQKEEEEKTKKSYDNFETLNLGMITSNEGLRNFQDSIACQEKHNKCARCKYYKNLNELDTIIESLKNFEKSILNDKNQTDFVKF